MFLRNIALSSEQYSQYTIKDCHGKIGMIIGSYSFILENTH